MCQEGSKLEIRLKVVGSELRNVQQIVMLVGRVERYDKPRKGGQDDGQNNKA